MNNSHLKAGRHIGRPLRNRLVALLVFGLCLMLMGVVLPSVVLAVSLPGLPVQVLPLPLHTLLM